MTTALKQFALSGIGGALYCIIETAARGYTHWTMFILGGVCFFIVGLLNEVLPWDWAITTQALAGAAVITLAEFVSGCVLNLWLNMNIWDYSEKPYNLLGQICLENCVYWLLLSAVAIVLDDWLRCALFDEEQPRYHL